MRTQEARAAEAGEEHHAPRPSPGGTSREDVLRGLRYVVGVFLALRVGITVLALVAVALLPAFAPGEVEAVPGPVDVVGWPAPPLAPDLGWDNVATSLERFDALWFLRIATAGYVDGDGSAAFFPGYPLAVRAVSAAMGGHPLAAGLLVSNLAFLAALAVLYFLTRTELSETHARRVVLYAAVFPTAFFFLAPYSESQFFLLAVTALWAARRRWWWLAGLAGALAAATRNVGLALVAPLFVEALLQWREDRGTGRGAGSGPRLGGALAATAAVGAGTGAYLLFWHRFGGDWLAPLHQQATWQREFAYPWETLTMATGEAFRWIGVYAGGYHLLDWLIVVPSLVACGYAAFRFRATFGVYAWASLAAPLLYIFPARPFMSLPRFLLPIFPLYWALARWGERRGVHEAIVATSAVLLGVMTLLFVNWYYVF